MYKLYLRYFKAINEHRVNGLDLWATLAFGGLLGIPLECTLLYTVVWLVQSEVVRHNAKVRLQGIVEVRKVA